MVEHVVDVDRLALERPLVAEDLHAVDELADAVGFRADELGQGPVGIGALAFEQLGGAPDAGERVLDFMSEHRGQSGDRARRAAVGELPLDHLRHAALLQHDHHAAGRVGQRPAIKIDELRRIEAEGAEIHAIFVDGGAVALHLLDEGDERAAEGDDFGERVAAQHARAHLEEILGRGVGIFEAKAVTDDEERMGQRAEQRFRLKGRRLGRTARALPFGRCAQAVYPRSPHRTYLLNFYATRRHDLLLCRILGF